MLLTARIWLSQAIFVHQLMMMMRAEEFAATPSLGAMLIRSVALLLLVMGLLTPAARPRHPVAWHRAG